MYFTNDDYQVFTEKNSAVKTSEMIQKRKALKNKMLKLHEKIYPEIEKIGLGCHDNSNNITSKIEPSKYNGKINNWLLVRYGKTANELEPYFGFTKHACIQFGIFENKGFVIELFLGRCDGFDFGKINRVKNEDIESEIAKLQGYGMKWEISGVGIFDIDEHTPEEFSKWLKENNENGTESFLSLSYKIDDERISDDNICEEIISKVKLFLPLYNVLANRKKG